MPDASSYSLTAGLRIGEMRPEYIVSVFSSSDEPHAARPTSSPASTVIAARRGRNSMLGAPPRSMRPNVAAQLREA
jgi:hypothetical protein